MSGLESLDEVSQDIQQAYEEECRISNGSDNHRQSISIRDLDLDTPVEEEGVITRKDMLESWQNLIKALNQYQVFLQYAPRLEKLFSLANFFDETKWKTAKILVDLMTETVENNDKDPSTDCRYLTLLEILSSYGGHWQLSHQLYQAWKQQQSTDKRADLNMTPEDFRREAYHVLMSFAWVPKTQGLYDVCGIEDGEPSSPSVPAIQAVFNQIQSSPLPRHDCVHRILTRFQKGPHVTMAITSPHDEGSLRSSSLQGQGLGKTTLAAMVASHPKIQAEYRVLWLSLNKDSSRLGSVMSYQQYTTYLDSLCEQLNVKPNWPKPIAGLEEPALSKKKEEEKMFQVKREMSRILQQSGNALLMVLDDVYNDIEMEWFWFMEDQSMLVTTLSQTLSVKWTLELESLSEAEALDLFVTEAEHSAGHVLRQSLEAKSIVQRCGYHPLTIRTAARWFRLKQVTAGVVKGLEELSHELSTCTAKLRHSTRRAASPTKVLKEIMNMMLSPVLAAGGNPTMLMKLCLSSMAVVFPRKVPLEAVHVLWGQLLRSEPDAVQELGDGLTPSQLRKRVRFIAEALTSLGLFIITEKDGIPYVEIHHEMQWEYAVSLVREMQVGGSEQDCTSRWHAAFAIAYLAKKVESDRDGLEDNCRSYALDNLLNHMIEAGMFKKVSILLSDQRFFSERLDHMGWSHGTESHIQDCKALQSAMEEDESIDADPDKVVVGIYNKSAAFIAEYAQTSKRKSIEEAAKSLQSIGFVLAEHGKYSDAVSLYKAALKHVSKPSILAGLILYSLSAAYVAKQDHDRALKNIKECITVMKDAGEKRSLYAEALMLKGDCLVTSCDYIGALDCYNSSYDHLFPDSNDCRVEIGVLLGRKGRLYQIMCELEKAYVTLNECVKLKTKVRESSCDFATAYRFLGDIALERSCAKGEVLELWDKAYRMFEHHGNKVDEVDTHIINGETDALNNDYEGCQESFDLALEAICESKRTLMERTAYDLRMIARTFMQHGDFIRALAAFNDCLKQTRDKSEESLERASALYDMGNLHLKRSETNAAFQCFEQSLKIRIIKLGPSETVVETLEKIGSLHKSVGENDDALSFFNKALELTEKLHGENSVKVADVLFLIAEVKDDLDEDDEAVAFFGECLEIRKENLPPRHLDIATTLVGLGKMHIKRFSYDKAYQCFVESLDIRQASVDHSNPAIGESYHYLGVVSRKGGDCDRGLQFLLEALHIRKELDDKSFTVNTLLEIGNVHRQLEDPDSATGCFEKCLEIILEQYGSEDARISDVLLPLGHAKKSMGRLDEAAELYSRALQIREKVYGNDHIKVAACYRSVGMLKFEQRDYKTALKQLTEFVRIQDINKQKNSIDYVVSLEIIGDIHKHNSNMDGAESAYTSALKAFNSHKEVSGKYPTLGPMLESRISHSGDAAPQSSGLLSRITGEFGRLNEEVRSEAKVDVTPEEAEFRQKILYDA